MAGNNLYCQSCDRTLQTKNDFDQHCKSKKHQVNEQMALEQEAAKRKIFVKGFDGAREPRELLGFYFSHFGKVQNIDMGGKQGNGFAIVEFKETQEVQQVISQRHHRFNGFSLYVKRFVYHPPKWESRQFLHQRQVQEEKKKMTETQHQIMDLLMSAENLPEQIRLVSESVGLEEKDKKLRAQICSELTKIFSPYFENCTVHQFGSSVNGFGAKGCDLDLFLDLHGNTTSDSGKKPKVQLPFHKDIASLRMLSHGPLTVDALEKVDLYDVVKLLSRILTTKSSNFTETLTIPSQRCPVVKFTHKVTGIKCDLSLNNRKALHNSHLLRLYGSEPRVHRLVSAVRLWMRTHELSGSGNSAHLFTSYAATLIIMFYVMQRKSRLIPLVCDLTDCVSGAHKEMVDDWECVSIPEDAVLPASENTETDIDLLKGFFDFCANSINWDLDALVTRNATMIQRGQISRDPAYMGCKVGCLTVLDPFVLTHNVAGNINERTKLRFIAELKRAAEITRNWPDDIPEMKSKLWGLAYLLVPPEVPKSSKPNGDSGGPKSKKGKGHRGKERAGKADNQPVKVNPTRVDGEQENGEFVIALSPLASTLSSEKLRSLAQQNSVSPELQWCSSAQQMVLDVLQSVFMIELKELSEEDGKSEEGKDTESGEMGTCLSVSEDQKEGKMKDEDKNVIELRDMEKKMPSASDVGCISKRLAAGQAKITLGMDTKGEDVADDISSCGQMDVVEEDQSEGVSGKRSSAAAHLDSSSNESLDTSDGREEKVHPPKQGKPNKKLCGGVSINADEMCSKIETCLNHNEESQAGRTCVSHSNHQCDNMEAENTKSLDANRRERVKEDKETDHQCEDHNTMSTSADGNDVIVSDSDNTGSTYHSSSSDTTQGQVPNCARSVSGSNISSSSSSNTTSTVTTSESELCIAMESISAPSPSGGEGPNIQVLSKSSYSCCCRHQLWLGRKILRSRVPSPWKLSGLAIEQEISKLVLKEAEKVKEKLLEAVANASIPTEVRVKSDGQGLEGDHAESVLVTSSEEKNTNGKTSSDSKSPESKKKKSHAKGKKTPPVKETQDSQLQREDFFIEFTCQIFQQSYENVELCHILVKMHPTPSSVSGFKNLFCSFRSMILRLVTSGMFDQSG